MKYMKQFGIILAVTWRAIRPVLVPVLVITVVSTILVMGVTGTVTQSVMRLRKRLTSRTDTVINRSKLLCNAILMAG